MESCDRCQRHNKLNKSVGTLHPIPVESRLFYQMGIDLIGPLPQTPRGNRYIVTLTDYFSKWAEAAPLPSKHAAGVSKFIYSVMNTFDVIKLKFMSNILSTGDVSIWLSSDVDYRSRKGVY